MDDDRHDTADSVDQLDQGPLMPAPARRSLRERDQHAIAPTPLPGQTAIDMPDTEAEPAQRQPEPAPAPSVAPRTAASPTRTAAVSGGTPRRLGIYFHPADFANAKAAYLADWQTGGTADTFAKWIGAVLLDHAQLTPAQRAEAALPARSGGDGSTRSFTLPGSVHDAVRAAVVADQGIGRWMTASTWAGVAVHTAVRAAEQRAGGLLVQPPRRLPNRLKH